MTEAWEHIERAASDRRSGSLGVAGRAAQGLAHLRTRRELSKAARMLLRAHPAMATLWQMLAAALREGTGEAAARVLERARAETCDAGDAFRWAVGRKPVVVLTHSSSSSVVAALDRARPRIARVVCTASLPGAEGRALARRLQRDGFEARVIADAAMAQACEEADVALVGADAVTDAGVVNKVGTRLLALAARDAKVPCYVVAGASKMLPRGLWRPERAPLFEMTALELFDAVLSERGPRSAGAIRRAVARVDIPQPLQELLK